MLIHARVDGKLADGTLSPDKIFGLPAFRILQRLLISTTHLVEVYVEICSNNCPTEEDFGMQYCDLAQKVLAMS